MEAEIIAMLVNRTAFERLAPDDRLRLIAIDSRGMLAR